MKNNKIKTLITIFIIVSAIFLILGFHKMFAYDGYRTNAYVGGDAYNYIINSNYATGYFVLSMFFGMVSIGLGIINTIKETLSPDIKEETLDDPNT